MIECERQPNKLPFIFVQMLNVTFIRDIYVCIFTHINYLPYICSNKIRSGGNAINSAIKL
ncbi:hypothetical protein DWW16_10690 [Bacteroides clarus]|nr:hypothetical protein DWW16_10690 [Bacteroides clarus]